MPPRRRTRSGKAGGDDETANYAPPKKKPARRKKKEPLPIEPAARSQLVRVLASEPQILRDVSSLVTYRDLASLGLVDSGADKLLGLKENSEIWKKYLPDVDEWKGFDKIPEDQRKLMEVCYGYRKICAMLQSGACRECEGGGAYINAISCERTCLKCWQSRDCGEHGTEGASRSQMCSVTYAKNRYMITDTDVKSICVLKVEDASKAHGLLGTKMNVMLVPDAVRLAIKRHGSLDTVEAKKTVKHALAMEKYRAKLSDYEATMEAHRREIREAQGQAGDTYDAALAAWRARFRAAASPQDYAACGQAPSYASLGLECVDTSHIERPKLKHPTAPKKSEATWNFVARNQRARTMGLVHDKYGLHKAAPPAELAQRGGKVYVCTEATDLAAVEAKFASFGNVLGIGENLFEVIHDAHHGATVVVDMRCDLRKMATACAKEKGTSLSKHFGCTVGGTEQTSTLMLHEDIKLVGAPGSLIFSDTACLWVSSDSQLVQIESLRFRTQPASAGGRDEQTNRSPCLVLSGGHCVVKDCVIEMGAGGSGNAMLAHSKLRMTGCTIANYGSSPGAGTMHFDDDVGFPEAPDFAFSGNTFVWTSGYMETHFPFGICIGPPTDQEVSTWKARVAGRQNALEASSSKTKTYAFKMMPEGGGDHEFVTHDERWRTTRPMTLSADPNTPAASLLATLATKSPKMEKSINSEAAPAPWLYLSATPDGTQPHPMTTIGEIDGAAAPKFNEHRPEKIDYHVMYILDRRDAAEDPMVIEE